MFDLSLNKLLRDGIAFAGFLIIAVILGYTISKGQIITAGFYIALPFLIGYLILLFRNPKVGLLTCIHFAFITNGLGRFIPGGIPFGLLTDAILLLTVVATIFKVSKEDARRMNNPLFYIMLIWFAYTMLQVVNPEARSKEAWFYAVRGVSLYMIQMIPLILILMNKREDMDQLIKIWFIWSIISAFYGFKMDLFGVTTGERQWLDEGGKITHEIHGRLRIFSFYSDAGQFGAAMAHTCISALLLAIGPYTNRQKYFYWFVCAVCFWGYALSGSRGPLFVIAGGGFLYLFLIGNFRILLTGAIIGGFLFCLLKFTHIGDANYQIHRMRTGLDPNDASLQVRIDNQKRLAVYLATRPLGGGIGSGGSWGARFSPGSFLSDVALDSWYVKIWVETGIVGLILHIITLITVLIVACIKVFQLKDPDLRQKIISLTCGYFGIIVASYGNQILGQMPTGTIIYFSMVYMFICTQWDPETQNEFADNKNPVNPALKPGKVFVKIS
ncbi:MAG: O-antigen ligase domain-containing protein [Bacteroidia bacterium]|nr:O-antigen ligase domain-containing protein [Bacteroidia bacterium]